MPQRRHALPIHQHLAPPHADARPLAVRTQARGQIGLTVVERAFDALEPVRGWLRGADLVRGDGVSRTRSANYFPAPILKILVPQVGQVPSVAGRPFFIVICFESLISRWVLHFMQ